MTCSQCSYQYCYVCGGKHNHCNCAQEGDRLRLINHRNRNNRRSCRGCFNGYMPLCKFVMYVLLSPLILVAIPLFLIFAFPYLLAKTVKDRLYREQIGYGLDRGYRHHQICKHLWAGPLILVFFAIGILLDVFAIPIILLSAPYLMYHFVQE